MLNRTLGIFLLSVGAWPMLAEASKAPFESGFFFYFRSNATSWDVDQSSMLKRVYSTSTEGLSYEVTKDWILNEGDRASLMATPQAHSWGNWQRHFNLSVDTVYVGKRYRLDPSPKSQAIHFNAVYPALGAYTICIDWPAQELWIEQFSELVAPCLPEFS